MSDPTSQTLLDAAGRAAAAGRYAAAAARPCQLSINGEVTGFPKPATMHVVRRQWELGDTVELRFPMPLRSSAWFARSRAIERGPLVYALDIEPEWKEVEKSRPQGIPDTAMHRGYLERARRGIGGHSNSGYAHPGHGEHC